jgi:ABC-type transport system substrate-binding protein
LTASADPSRIMIQELVQDQLKRAGVEARPENTPFPALSTELTRGNFDLELTGYGKQASGAVPAQFRQGGGNWGYSNPRLHQVVAQAANVESTTPRAVRSPSPFDTDHRRAPPSATD